MRELSFAADRPFDVVGIGGNSIDRLMVLHEFPQPGSRNEILRQTRTGGGQVATALVAQARLGLRVKYLGKVGDDADGAWSKQSLSDAGVDVADVVTVAGAETQNACILVSETTGERTICSHHSPLLALCNTDFVGGQLDQASLLHLDTHNVERNVEAAREAHAYGIPVLVDAERVGPAVDELLSLCDVVIADLRFARAYTGEHDPERMLATLGAKLPARITGITLGPQGSIVSGRGEMIRTPSYTVPVVDTTGAGDTFHGAFGYALLRGWPLDQVCRFANAVAALKCRGLGGRTTLPRLEEVAEFMGETLDLDLPVSARRDLLPPGAAIDDAWAFAREAHRGHYRDADEPFMAHVARVAIRLYRDFGVDDPDLVAVSLLHDVMEDVPVEPIYLRQRFGSRVYQGVRTLTKDGRLSPQEQERHYRLVLENAPPEILLIKMADRIDNLLQHHVEHLSLDAGDYLDITRYFYLPLAQRRCPQAVRPLLDALAKAQIATPTMGGR